MTDEQKHTSELAAQHADRVADRLKACGDRRGEGILRMFAGSLRSGAHLRPPQSQEEANARAVAILEDVLRCGR
jgi:hypothetical protein